MRKRISALLVAGLAIAAVGTTTSVALAKHGADDPAGHIRHAHRADHATKSRAARHGRRADDAPGHVRHGADDGPNHR